MTKIEIKRDVERYLEKNLSIAEDIIDKIKIKSVNFDLEFISAPQYDPQEIIRNIANFAVGKSLN